MLWMSSDLLGDDLVDDKLRLVLNLVLPDERCQRHGQQQQQNRKQAANQDAALPFKTVQTLFDVHGPVLLDLASSLGLTGSASWPWEEAHTAFW